MDPDLTCFHDTLLYPIETGTHPGNKSLDDITQVDVNGSPIPISDSIIKLLGVTMDASLAFNKHVSLIC